MLSVAFSPGGAGPSCDFVKRLQTRPLAPPCFVAPVDTPATLRLTLSLRQTLAFSSGSAFGGSTGGTDSTICRAPAPSTPLLLFPLPLAPLYSLSPAPSPPSLPFPIRIPLPYSPPPYPFPSSSSQ